MSFNNKFGSFAFSAIGHSHAKKGKECQDAGKAFAVDGCTAVVVCDGHGGDKHFRSAVGSKMAVDVVERVVRDSAEFCRRCRTKSRAALALRILETQIVEMWRCAVFAHVYFSPFTQSELAALSDGDRGKVIKNPLIAYGSTCISAFVSGRFLYLIQLGDGDIRLLNRYGCYAPIKKDDRLVFGATTSLCDDRAITNIRDHVIPVRKVRECRLSTDGVKNSFCDETKFCDFFDTVSREYASKLFDEFSSEVQEFLPKLSARGSGDDVTIACICKKCKSRRD